MDLAQSQTEENIYCDNYSILHMWVYISSCRHRLNDSCRIAADSSGAYCITAFDQASVTTIAVTGGTFPKSPSNPN